MRVLYLITHLQVPFFGAENLVSKHLPGNLAELVDDTFGLSRRQVNPRNTYNVCHELFEIGSATLF
jgi:hypothetical protein